MIKSRFGTAAFLGLLMIATSCVPIVVKVNKNARDVDTSGLSSAQDAALALNNPAEFLKSAVVKDTLIKLVAQNKDQWVTDFRADFRKYRQTLIDQATKGGVIDDSFYNFDDCQSFDILHAKKAFNIFHLIAHTALFASVADFANSQHLSSSLQAEETVKEVVALVDVVFGVITAPVSDNEGYAGFSIKLAALDTEGDAQGVTADVKAADASQVLTILVKRDVSDQGDNIGKVFMKSSITHLLADGKTIETIEGKFSIGRSKGDGIYVINVDASLGIQGQDPSFTRSIVIETVKDNSKQIKITDYISATKVYVSTLTVDGTTLKWCKVKDAPTIPSKVVEDPCAGAVKLLGDPSGDCVAPTATPAASPAPTPVPTSNPNNPGQNNPGQNPGKGK